MYSPPFILREIYEIKNRLKLIECNVYSVRYIKFSEISIVEELQYRMFSVSAFCLCPYSKYTVFRIAQNRKFSEFPIIQNIETSTSLIF